MAGKSRPSVRSPATKVATSPAAQSSPSAGPIDSRPSAAAAGSPSRERKAWEAAEADAMRAERAHEAASPPSGAPDAGAATCPTHGRSSGGGNGGAARSRGGHSCTPWRCGAFARQRPIARTASPPAAAPSAAAPAASGRASGAPPAGAAPGSQPGSCRPISAPSWNSHAREAGPKPRRSLGVAWGWATPRRGAHLPPPQPPGAVLLLQRLVLRFVGLRLLLVGHGRQGV